MGIIPQTFVNLGSLREFLLNNNQLNGPLVLPKSPNLTNVDISSNYLTGEIPSYLIQDSPRLHSFSASKNCLSVDIPDSICLAQHLTFLCISGLYQTDGCDSGNLDLFTYPALPDCLWQMSTLETLNAIGNGYCNELNDKINLPNIRVLQLGSNNFVGSVDTRWSIISNHRNFEVFDISRNKIYGNVNNIDISPTNPHNSSNRFRIKDNRLSGRINVDMLSKYSQGQVSALQGNVIDCSTMPTYDSDYSTYYYRCETKELDTSIYFSFGAIVVVIVFCSICMYAFSTLDGSNALLDYARNFYDKEFYRKMRD